MTTAMSTMDGARDRAGRINAREAMEALNADAGKHHIWLRTQANAPAQRPWFRPSDPAATGSLSSGRVGAGQMKAVPHLWAWSEISPYLLRIAEIARNADVPPSAFADRQQFALTNPGLGGRLQVASTIRCAVSIYNPGDLAPVHVHTPNASRTILSQSGGYTTVEGELCRAERGDIILTPNGCWHDHGNDGSDPVMWVDVLDWPLLEYLDCIWLDDDFPGRTSGGGKAQEAVLPAGHSQCLYGAGGIVPAFVAHQRGFGRRTSPMFRYSGAEIRAALDGMRSQSGDPYEGIQVRLRNPVTSEPVFPTLEYGAQLLRAGEESRLKRETANTLYIVIDGHGFTEVAGQRLSWRPNDIFVVPNFLWRRHICSGQSDALIYSISDEPLLERIGQYRAQGRRGDGSVEELA